MEQPQQPAINQDGEQKKPESLSTQINTWVKTLAILVGGFWAWYVWHNRDWPSLQQRQKADSQVKWAHPEKDMIHAEYNVTMTNGGSKPFTVARAHLRVWLLDKAVAYSKDSGFLDANRFIRNGRKPIVDANFTAKDRTDSLGAPFCQEYQPGATWPENFDIPMVLDRTKLALFVMQFYEDEDEKILDWTYFWDPVGGDSLSETLPSKQSPVWRATDQSAESHRVK